MLSAIEHTTPTTLRGSTPPDVTTNHPLTLNKRTPSRMLTRQTDRHKQDKDTEQPTSRKCNEIEKKTETLFNKQKEQTHFCFI